MHSARPVARARPVPRDGEVFLDARGGARTLRVSWHHGAGHDEAGIVVLSLWRGGVCVGTFRLPAEEVPDLVEALRRGLASAYDAAHDPLRLASEI